MASIIETKRKIWIISDPHFFHDNIYKFTYLDGTTRIRSKFESREEGDQFMLDVFNQVVKPEDHCWWLGDIFLKTGGRDALVKWMRQFNGHNRLVLGNHDKCPIQWYAEMGFQKVAGVHRLFDTWLTHFPAHQQQLNERVLGNIHGHIHQNDSPPGAYFNASVERINYTPIEFEAVRAELKTIKEMP